MPVSRLRSRAMEETWTSRDLPVLDAVVQLLDESPGGLLLGQQVVERTGMDPVDVERAVWALRPGASWDSGPRARAWSTSSPPGLLRPLSKKRIRNRSVGYSRLPATSAARPRRSLSTSSLRCSSTGSRTDRARFEPSTYNYAHGRRRACSWHGRQQPYPAG